MKLEIASFDLDCIEFRDRLGVMRRSYGCSPYGREEFKAYLDKLNEIIEAQSDPRTAIEFYLDDDVFRHCCDRILELNAINPDWLDGQGLILTGLIFDYQGGPGLLVRLNAIAPDDVASPSDGKPATAHDIAAALLSATRDLKQTLDILRTEPAKQVTGTLKAVAEHQLNATEEGKNAGRRKWAAQRRERAKTTPQPFDPSALSRL